MDLQFISKKLATTPTTNPPTPDQKDWTEADVPSHFLVKYLMGTLSTKLRRAIAMPKRTVLVPSGFSRKKANCGTGRAMSSTESGPVSKSPSKSPEVLYLFPKKR